eukprot:52732-Rhodomonas_salina.3
MAAPAVLLSLHTRYCLSCTRSTAWAAHAVLLRLQSQYYIRCTRCGHTLFHPIRQIRMLKAHIRSGIRRLQRVFPKIRCPLVLQPGSAIPDFSTGHPIAAV